MRSHAKAATAGSTKRLGRKSKPALLLCVLAASVAALALVVGSASGATTRFLVEVFGSSAQPTFPADRGMAFDQGASQLYVIDSTNDTISRFNADGTAANFGALGSNVIDGVGAGDETPLGHLAFESNRQREQIAIDESGGATDGNVYATRSASDVVDVFSSTGEYKGTLSESTGTGAFGEPCGVAVDSAGNVYVGDRGDDRIHVYEPAGAFPVNADNTASFATVTDPCTLAAGAGATAGFLFVNASTGAQLRKVDAVTGEVKYEIATGASTVSVDPATGHVFVARNTGSSSSVDEYDASGAGSATLVSSFKPGSTVEGIALNSGAEQVYVARSGTESVEVFGPAAVIPDVVTEVPSSNTGYRATLAGTVNPDGVELDECFFEWGLEVGGSAVYGNVAPCAETPAEIGTGTAPVAVHADVDGLVPADLHQVRLVAVNPNARVNGANKNFNTPNTVFAEAASPITPTEATLNGTVNPDTAAISECLFEWGVQKEVTDAFQDLPNIDPCVPGPGGITGESPVAVQAELSGLHPGTTYLYRLKVGYPNATIVNPFSPLTLQTSGPVIEGSWVEDVTFAEAALKAEINPAGSATTYRFEYGKTAAYGLQTEELNVGSDSSTHEVSRFLDDLEPGTTYHYRLVATSGVAENVGSDQTFVTYDHEAAETDCPNQALRGGASAKLPNCRAYEMVSPVDKSGIDITQVANSLNNELGSDQAALDGDKLAYAAERPFGDAASSLFPGTQYIASRGAGGWSSHAISPAHENNLKNIGSIYLAPGRYSAFSEDLSTGFLYDDAKPPLTADASTGVANFYLRDNDTETYKALTTQFLSGDPELRGMGFMGYSKDGSHTLFAAQAQLTPDANPGSETQLYDYHDGELELVSVLPNGSPAIAGSAGAGGAVGYNDELGETRSAISDDGSRIFWTAYTESVFNQAQGRIYARLDGETTIPVSESVSAAADATYWGAASDGSQVIFTSGGSGAGGEGVFKGGDLYRFDVDSETPALIAGEVHPARGVLGASEDASHVYFLSKEALAAGATAGRSNLYLDHNGAKTFIATLAGQDEAGEGATADNGSLGATGGSGINRDFSQVTPDGSNVVFISTASLTGYDNTSRRTGGPATEIYRYDAPADELACISCNPSGGRPITRRLPQPHRVDPSSLGAPEAAAWLPTPRRGTYTPRMVSDDGNLIFFNAIDALVPQDANGVQDVYQWEALGTGSCQEAEGCVNLISTGTNPVQSTFIDAGEGGADVFFRTNAGIDPRDPGLVDIYNARAGGGFPSPASPPECAGDACQDIPPAPNDPTPASAGFGGLGDPAVQPSCGAAAKRAGKLSRRAKRLRRAAKRNARPSGSKALRRRAARSAKQAKRLSQNAKRCRRNNRRAGR